MNAIVVIPLIAFAATVLLHAVVLKLFPRWNLLDFPERYGLARARLPYPTGIIAILVFLIFFAVLNPWNTLNVSIAIAITILATICFIDDRKPLHSPIRLLTQFLAATLLFLGGARIYSITNPLEGMLGENVLNLSQGIISVPLFGTVPLLSGIFTLLWLGLTINALNWFDGIPGQVSTISTIGFLTIGLLSLSDRVHQPSIAVLALILAGIAAGCFLFDFPSPRVLMGDTGAMFFGLMIGTLTIYAGQGKVATAFLVLGVPLIDSFLVVVQRLLKGKSPLKGDREQTEHLHHRLLKKGWSPRFIILLTGTTGTAFGIAALFLSTFEKFVAGLILFLITFGLFLYSKPVTT